MDWNGQIKKIKSLNLSQIIVQTQSGTPTPVSTPVCASQPFFPRDTLCEHYHYLAAPLDAKICLTVNKSDNRRHL